MHAEHPVFRLAGQDHHLLAHGASCRPDGPGHTGIVGHAERCPQPVCDGRVMGAGRGAERDQRHRKPGLYPAQLARRYGVLAGQAGSYQGIAGEAGLAAALFCQRCLQQPLG